MKLNIGSSIDPTEVTVSKLDTVQEVLQANNIRVTADSTLTLDTVKLGDNDMNRTLEELGAQDGSFLTFTKKMRSGK